MLLDLARQEEENNRSRPPRGRTAVHPTPLTADAATRVLDTFGAAWSPIEGSAVGCEITGLDIAAMGGALPPELAGALEVLMAVHGLCSCGGRAGRSTSLASRAYTSRREKQCRLSECFGAGALHSTHGVHPEAPCRDIFRLSNDPNHGFNSVGPEWHNDGSFCREVFGHVVYHIVKAPDGAGDTRFAHLGVAYDSQAAAVQKRLRRCASVNSNGGAVHPLAAQHPLSGRTSLYLHLGMTGAMLEVPPSGDASGDASVSGDIEGGGGGGCSGRGSGMADVSDGGGGGSGGNATLGVLCDAVAPPTLTKLKGAVAAEGLGLPTDVVAWPNEEMDGFFSRFSALLDDPAVSYSHKWREGDVVIIDNLAVAHKAAPGAHAAVEATGLRILHRTTILSSRAHDPPAHLALPHTLDTRAACPFEPPATWCEGYVGFRWGRVEERSVPH